MKKMIKRYWFAFMIIGLMAITSGILLSTTSIAPKGHKYINNAASKIALPKREVKAHNQTNKQQNIIIEIVDGINNTEDYYTDTNNKYRANNGITNYRDVKQEDGFFSKFKDKFGADVSPGTMEINGDIYNLGKTFTDADIAQQYIDSNQFSNIAIEWGSLDVKSGQGVKIAGHAPGVFSPLVNNVNKGTKIKIVDHSGKKKTYKVKELITHPQGVPSSDSVNNLYNKTQQNESVVLQFCVNDMNYLYYAE